MFKIISKIFTRLQFYVNRFYLLYVKKDDHTINVAKWHKDSANNDVRYNIPLSKSAIVIDLGGYIGDWAGEIDNRYSPNIYIYEPVPEYYEKIRNRFSGKNNVRVMRYGLSNISGTARIAIMGDGSSTYTQGETAVDIILKDIVSEFNDKKFHAVDLIKINIEGAEYDLLERMIEHNMIHGIDYFQIQFHRFIPGAVARRESIRKSLYETHDLVFDYPFVWEGWKRRA